MSIIGSFQVCRTGMACDHGLCLDANKRCNLFMDCFNGADEFACVRDPETGWLSFSEEEATKLRQGSKYISGHMAKDTEELERNLEQEEEDEVVDLSDRSFFRKKAQALDGRSATKVSQGGLWSIDEAWTLVAACVGIHLVLLLTLLAVLLCCK